VLSEAQVGFTSGLIDSVQLMRNCLYVLFVKISVIHSGYVHLVCEFPEGLRHCLENGLMASNETSGIKQTGRPLESLYRSTKSAVT